CQQLFIYIFFFSSRRRHTRCYRDWSSDVCSSDLALPKIEDLPKIDVKFGSEFDVDLRKVLDLGQSPRLGAVGQVTIRKIKDRDRSEERRVGKERRGGSQRRG